MPWVAESVTLVVMSGICEWVIWQENAPAICGSGSRKPAHVSLIVTSWVRGPNITVSLDRAGLDANTADSGRIPAKSLTQSRSGLVIGSICFLDEGKGQKPVDDAFIARKAGMDASIGQFLSISFKNTAISISSMPWGVKVQLYMIAAHSGSWPGHDVGAALGVFYFFQGGTAIGVICPPFDPRYHCCSAALNQWEYSSLLYGWPCSLK
jgi:hypothetical protein